MVFRFAQPVLLTFPTHKGGVLGSELSASGSRLVPGRLTTAYGLVRAGLMSACDLSTGRSVKLVRECMRGIGRHWLVRQESFSWATDLEGRRVRTETIARGSLVPVSVVARQRIQIHPRLD